MIELLKSGRRIEVPQGANLMRALQNAEIPVASSCNGDGVCVKCRLTVVAGRENLSVESDLEGDLRDIHGFAKNERLSCQALVLGDVTVDAGYW